MFRFFENTLAWPGGEGIRGPALTGWRTSRVFPALWELVHDEESRATTKLIEEEEEKKGPEQTKARVKVIAKERPLPLRWLVHF